MPISTLQKWEYLASYGDLINAFGPDVVRAYSHYQNFTTGIAGDPQHPGTEVRPITFDAWEYLASYDDLITAFSHDVDPGISAARHYVTYGYGEHRDTNAFDAQAYLANYADLRTAFGTDVVAAEKHYVIYGRAEGRNDYTLTALSATAGDAAGHVGEGHTVIFTLDTHDLPQGRTFSYSLSGITLADLADGSLSGTATVGADGKAIISVDLEADHVTEGAETLTLHIDDHTASVTVDDLSILDAPGTFTLTGDTDVETANVFNSAPVRYILGSGFLGDNRINSLQDEDKLTGSGVNPTLNATLGNTNDAGSYDITPQLRGIKIVNVAFSNTDGTYLDLQDSGILPTGSALTDVNVTRISTSGSHVVNMWGETVNLSAHNSHDIADMEFSYINSKLAGNQTVNLLLENVTADHLDIGAENIQTQQIETLNLTVAANGASSVNVIDLRPDGISSTHQTLNIVANDALIIAEDWNRDAGSVPAVPTVLGYPAARTGVASQSAGHVFPVAGLEGHDLGYILHDNGFTFDTVESLEKITVAGSGDVTLGSVGSAPAFLLDGSAAWGKIAVNISNAAEDASAIFRTGHNDDTVIVGNVLEGFSGSGHSFSDLDYGSGYNPYYSSPITLAGKVYTGDGNDVVLANDLAESYSNPLYRTLIDTGSGDDTVVVGILHGNPGQPAAMDGNGAQILLGDGNDSVTALNLEEEAQIDAGNGNDVINLTTAVSHYSGSGNEAEWVGTGYTVIAGDATVDADGHGAEVLAGSGDDLVHFLFTGTGLRSHLGGDSVIEGYVDGGAGNDAITVDSNKSLDLVHGHSSTLQGPDGTGSSPITKAITSVETLTLNSTTAWDGEATSSVFAPHSENRVLAFNGVDGTGDGTRTIIANDDNGYTADYTVDRSQFDSALRTINLNHEDGVILNIQHEHNNYVAFAGDEAADTLTNLLGTEKINLTALETFTNQGTGNYDGSGHATTGTGAAADPLGTVYGPGLVNSVCGVTVPFTADLYVNLALENGTGTGDVADITINGDNAITSIWSDIRPATTVLNSDFSLNDIGSGTHSYESLALAVNGNHNHGVDLNNDFAETLTVTGDGTGGGNLTLVNVNATVIQTGGADLISGYKGNVYVGVESEEGHHITTGIGNDIVRLGDEHAIHDFNDYVSLGSGNDIVVFNGLSRDGGTGSVNHGGLTNGDTVIGGAGYDTIAVGGEVSLDGVGRKFGVTISESELQRVSGFEAIQFSVGQAEIHAEPYNFDYSLRLRDSVYSQNGYSTNNALLPNEKVIDIINNNVSAAGEQLAELQEGNTVIDLLGLSIDYQITYNGATNAEGNDFGGSGSGTGCISDHGSNDRFIFDDANLDGGDTINGGANDGDGTTVKNAGGLHEGAYQYLPLYLTSFYLQYGSAGSGLGNRDVLEVRDNAEVTSSSDLLHISNVGTIAFNNDLGTNQTLIIDLNDSVVDSMVDSLHSSSTGAPEILLIKANDGTVTQDHAAQLHLDASQLTAKSGLGIGLDTQNYGSAFFGSGSLIEGTFGTDEILGGASNEYINGMTSNDVVDGGHVANGTGYNDHDTIGFTTYFNDFSNNQIQNIEVLDVWHDVNHTGPGSDKIFVDVTSQTEGFFINVHEHNVTTGLWAGNTLLSGQGNDTIHIFDNYAYVDGGSGNDIITVDGSGNHDGEWIFGGDGSDSIVGGSGADEIFAYSWTSASGSGLGNDTITGGAGNDDIWLNAGTGNGNVDVVKTAWGGEGVDTIHNFTAGSGAGHDVFTFTGTSDIAGFSINPSLLQSGVNLNGGGGANAGVQAGFVTVLDNAATLDATGIANALSAGVNKLSTFASATHDVFYLAIDNNVDTEIVKINDLNGDGTITSNEITLIAHLVGVTDAGTLVHANFGNLP